MPFKLLHSEYISRHPYFTARKDRYQTDTGKIVDPYFVVELPVSVCAMAISENNEVLMVKQYRHPVKTELIELPGGFIDPEEDASAAIRRELLEETGYEFEQVYHLGNTAANPGVLSNFTELFLLTGGKRKAEQKLDDNEEIEVILRSVEEVSLLLKNNEVKQSMHALCLFYGLEKLKELQQL